MLYILVLSKEQMLTASDNRLGPKGIARLCAPFPRFIRDQHDTPYLAAKRLANERAREAALLQEQEFIQSNSQVCDDTGSIPGPSGTLGDALDAAAADLALDGDLSLGSDIDLNDVDPADLVKSDDDFNDLDDVL